MSQAGRTVVPYSGGALALVFLFKVTLSIQLNETLEQQAFPAGKAALGRPHSLRVLSSEAVPNPFPTCTELLPHQHRT